MKVPKKLYKEFIIEGNYSAWREDTSGSQQNRRKILTGPYSGTGYRNIHGTRLTSTNLKGFRVRPVQGKLSMCCTGYHAGTMKGWFGSSIEQWKKNNLADDSPHLRILCEVKLIGVQRKHQWGSSGKWVARSFKIIKQVA